MPRGWATNLAILEIDSNLWSNQCLFVLQIFENFFEFFLVSIFCDDFVKPVALSVMFWWRFWRRCGTVRRQAFLASSGLTKGADGGGREGAPFHFRPFFASAEFGAGMARGAPPPLVSVSESATQDTTSNSIYTLHILYASFDTFVIFATDFRIISSVFNTNI